MGRNHADLADVAPLHRSLLIGQTRICIKAEKKAKSKSPKQTIVSLSGVSGESLP